MPFVIRPEAFKQKPDLFSALSDAGVASSQYMGRSMEALELAHNLGALKERLKLMGREDTRRETEFQNAQTDRATQQSADIAISGAQEQLFNRQQALNKKPQNAADTGMMGMAAGQSPVAIGQDFLQGLSPAARARAVGPVQQLIKGHIIEGKVKTLSGQLQDTFKGFQQTPGAEQFVEPLQALIGELDLMEGLEPEQQAEILHRVEIGAFGIKKAAYSQVLRERSRERVMQQIPTLVQSGMLTPQEGELLETAMSFEDADPENFTEIVTSLLGARQKRAAQQSLDEYRDDTIDVKRERNDVLEKQGNRKLDQGDTGLELKNKDIEQRAADKQADRENRITVEQMRGDVRREIEGMKAKNGGKALNDYQRMSLATRLLEATQFAETPLTSDQALKEVGEMEATLGASKPGAANTDAVLEFFQNELKKP